jgi:hypothetical protein
MLDVSRYTAHKLIPCTTFDNMKVTHELHPKCMQFVMQTPKTGCNYM